METKNKQSVSNKKDVNKKGIIYSWEGEELWEHSMRVADFGRRLFTDEVALYNERVSELVQEHYARINDKASELAGLKADWWLLTALLHDVGKAHKPFQKAPYKSFKCHEVYSASFAYRALERYGDASHVVAMAVLLHHKDVASYLLRQQDVTDTYYELTMRIGKCVNIEVFDPVDELSEYANRISQVTGVKLEKWEYIPVREVLKDIFKKRVFETALIAFKPLVFANAAASAFRL